MDDQQAKREEQLRQEVIAQIDALRPIDDMLMRRVFQGDLRLAQHVLRTLTGIETLVVTKAETQYDAVQIGGARSVELDVVAHDETGTVYDIEVQRGDTLDPYRLRFHGSVMDIESLHAGSSFDKLPERWVIFVMEGDPVGDGLATHHWQMLETTTYEPLGDATHALVANGAYRGDDELGYLMHDFLCADPDKMLVTMMGERVQLVKSTMKGVLGMKSLLDEYREECFEMGREQGLEKGLEQGLEKGRVEALAQTSKSLMEQLDVSITDALRLMGVSESDAEAVMAIA
jgi:hypothetical protein